MNLYSVYSTKNSFLFIVVNVEINGKFNDTGLWNPYEPIAIT